MEVKFMRRLTESHIDALYEAMEERMMERMEALENNKYNRYYFSIFLRTNQLLKETLNNKRSYIF